VSNFAPDITGIRPTRRSSPVEEGQPGKTVGSFGPPSYGGVQIALNAIALASSRAMARLTPGRAGQHQEVKVKTGSSVGTSAVDEVERPAEREFYISRSVERLVRARRLADDTSISRAARNLRGRPV